MIPVTIAGHIREIPDHILDRRSEIFSDGWILVCKHDGHILRDAVGLIARENQVHFKGVSSCRGSQGSLSEKKGPYCVAWEVHVALEFQGVGMV